MLLVPVSCAAPAPAPAPAPSPKEVTSYPIEIEDQLGRVVKLDKRPQRIISLDPTNTEILFALGLGDKVVGVTEYCDYPSEATEKEKVGKTRLPDIEKVIALQPDLILAASYQEKEIIPYLEKRGPTVFALAPKNLDGVLHDIQVVGRIAGKEEEASKLVAQLESRIKAITDKTEKLEQNERPKVFYICWSEPIYTAGKGTFINDLMVNAGGENIFSDIEGFQAVNIEAVIVGDPQVIIATTMLGAGDAPEWVRSEPLLKNVAARKNGRIYTVDSHLIDRHGPRIVKGLEEVAKCIHPEVFGTP